MIRPLGINNNVHFGNKTVNSSSKSEETKSNSYDQKDMKTKTQNAFMLGVLAGGIIASTGTVMLQDAQLKEMLNEIAAESLYDKESSISVEDITNDGTPEIVLKGSDGASTVYDMKNNNVYFQMGDELIEEMR